MRGIAGVPGAEPIGPETDRMGPAPVLKSSSSSGRLMTGGFVGLIGFGETTILGACPCMCTTSGRSSSYSASPGRLITGTWNAGCTWLWFELYPPELAPGPEPYTGASSGVRIVGIDGTDEDDVIVEGEGEGDRRKEGGGGASSKLRSKFAGATRGVFITNGG